MSGRKQKTERKKTKKTKKVERTESQVCFEDALLAFLRNVGQRVGKFKSRGGAQTLGPVAMSVCATEALDLGRSAENPQEYLSAAAYALATAMQQGRAWALPLKPAPEQSPESSEKPSEAPESKGKEKSRGKGE